jgi:TrkA-C domain
MTGALFIIVLVVSFIIVRIGAIAFQLTGLEWSLAKFQALSCFTGTGFTTREAELITSIAQRRRIASVLMVLGNAGLVLMIATVAQSFRADDHIWTGLSRRFLPFEIPTPTVPWVNLGLFVVSVYIIYRLLAWPVISDRITRFLRKRIIKREIFKRVTVEELLLATGGHGVSRVAVLAGSPVIDKSLVESGLRSYDITVLAIVRDGQTVANPPASMKILRDDELICSGKLGNIRSRILMNP